MAVTYDVHKLVVDGVEVVPIYVGIDFGYEVKPMVRYIQCPEHDVHAADFGYERRVVLGKLLGPATCDLCSAELQRGAVVNAVTYYRGAAGRWERDYVVPMTAEELLAEAERVTQV